MDTRAQITIALSDGTALIPRPLASYAELWGTRPDLVNRWANAGRIPGVFKGPDGQWWASPMKLIGWTPDEAAKGERDDRARAGRVSSPHKDPRHQRVRAHERDLRASGE